MKKIILILVVLTLSLSSCSDFLNLTPKNTKVIYTIEDVKQVMGTFLYATQYTQNNGQNGNYVVFNGYVLTPPYNKYAQVMSAIYSNDFELNSFIDRNLDATAFRRSGQGYIVDYMEARKWDGYLFAEQLWQGVFQNVGYLNAMLRDLKGVPDYNQIVGERIKGEAKVIRAYYLLKLNQMFAPYDRNDLGIPFNLDADVFTGGARYKQTEVYNILIGELMEVLDYQTPPQVGWNMFYNKRIIYAILAQTYMYKAESCAKESSDWENALKYAGLARAGQRVEKTPEEQDFSAFSPTEKQFEVLGPFSLLSFNSPGDSGNSGSNNYTPWGHPDALAQSPSNELYELYDDDDIRKNIFFVTQNEKVKVRKSSHSTGSVDKYNQLHALFRIADMMLIEAEAKFRMGDQSGALLLLNEFKRSKIPSFTGYTGNDVLGEILKERRKEFCFEQQMNWIDMKRTNVSVTRTSLNDDTSEMETYTLDANDFRYTLPIPTNLEIDYNGIPQNPGWTNNPSIK